ncbi:MAG: hypothetical protein B6245_07930 [Desulfobacteraceae bacterium 4572_88]|nr:MAG: hypothetical protein B6245_07930 [Desulfobacteraceae bacterium 4572_88]
MRAAGYTEPTEIDVFCGLPGGDVFVDPVLNSGTITIISTETVTAEIHDDNPVSFDFEKTSDSAIIDLPAGGGIIRVSQYSKAAGNLPNSAVGLFSCEISDAEYLGGFPAEITFIWNSPAPPADASPEDMMLFFSENKELWTDAVAVPEVSDIVWNLDSPPYSVSFMTNHFSYWTLAAEGSGDMKKNEIIGLRDVILSLKILTESDIRMTDLVADTDGDGQIGMDDVIYILRRISDLQ